MSFQGWWGRLAEVFLAFLLLSPSGSPPHAVRALSSDLVVSASPPLKTALRSPAPQAPLQQVSGMVLRVDPEVPRLDVLTGVGLALRVLQIHCDESTAILSGGSAVSLASLKRGDPVHVSCRHSAEGYLANRIELLPRPGTEGGPP
jgi:hypothetical protein